MKLYLKEFFKRYSYPKEAVDCLIGAYESIGQNQEFCRVLKCFYNKPHLACLELKNTIGNIATKTGEKFETTALIFYSCLSAQLEEQYEKNNIDKNIFFETAEDLKFKMDEYYELTDIWGIEPFEWFYNLFHMEVFAFGRLQYSPASFFFEKEILADRIVHKDDTVIAIHIPSSKRPFDKETRLKSYKMACEFFKKRLGHEPVFYCDSWLLYPSNREILGEGSNIVSFMDDFKIIDSYTYSDNHILWRIFGKESNLPPEKLPQNTSMQKNIAKWLASGKSLGAGIGIFVYDEKNKMIIK